MDTCKYCSGGGATHDPGCPAATGVESFSERRKFDALPAWLAGGRSDECAFCRGTGEHAEDCPLADPDAPDFSNIDLLDRAMAHGDVSWLEKVRDYCSENGMNDMEMDRSIECQRLRRKTHEAMKNELEERLRTSPEPTTEELNRGAFEQMIEPQVRDALRVMRRKGYSTTSSGFNSLDAQSVGLASPDLLDMTPDEIATLKDAGLHLYKGLDGFSFRVHGADLDEIKREWDEIAAMLPDLGHAAPEAEHPAARHFRQKYGGKA